MLSLAALAIGADFGPLEKEKKRGGGMKKKRKRKEKSREVFIGVLTELGSSS